MNMWMKAELSHNADMENLKSQIRDKHFSVSKNGNKTIILFTGSALDGVDIMEKVIQEGHCHIELRCGF